MQSCPEEAGGMKITIQIDGEDVASAISIQKTPHKEILEKATTLGAEEAGPAPTITLGTGSAAMLPSIEMGQMAYSKEMAIDCGEAPREFQSKAVSGWQAGTSLTELTEAKDAGKAVQQ
jgi:hypothetical protein